MRFLPFLFVLSFVAACTPPPPAPSCETEEAATLELGVPDSITFLDYEALPAGGDIPLSSSGQGFPAIQAALRGVALPAFAQVRLEVTLTATSATGFNTELVDLTCRNDGMRYIVPFVLDAFALGNPVDIQDAEADLEIEVRDPADASFVLTATGNGFLRRLDQ